MRTTTSILSKTFGITESRGNVVNDGFTRSTGTKENKK